MKRLALLMMCSPALAFDAEVADQLGTDYGRNLRAHAVLQGDTVNSFDGYLIGFQKVAHKRLFPSSPRSTALGKWNGKLAPSAIDPEDGEKTFLEQRAGDPKCPLPTHAVRLDGKSPRPARTLFSIYDGTWRDDLQANRAFDRLWREIAQLRAPISRDLASGRYTHLVLLSMGWNTQQDETILNARDLLRELRAARAPGERFVPLVVAISWNSYWDLGILGKALVGIPGRISLKNKANDVDEVAQTWVGHLLRDVLVPLKRRHQVPLVLVGHSLGARLVTTAACSGWTLGREARPGDIDLVVALQGAFPVLRFAEARHGFAPAKVNRSKRLVFDNFASHAGRFILTWSSADESRLLEPIVMLFTDRSPYALGERGSRVLGQSPQFTSVAVATAQLDRTAASLPAPGKATPGVVVDASRFIDGKARDTSLRSAERTPAKLARSQCDNGPVAERQGRASPHSDIYDDEMGRFLLGCIRRYAP